MYDYYTNGGSLEDSEKLKTPVGPESRTDSGRVVYGGGGITPDVKIQASRIPGSRGRFQQKLVDPIFSFVLKLTSGSVEGFENYAVTKPIIYGYDIKADDFPISERLLNVFMKFAETKYGIDPKGMKREKEFLARMLRTELVTAAYGSQTSFQVYNEYDLQLRKAIELFPQAVSLRNGKTRQNAKAASSNK